MQHPYAPGMTRLVLGFARLGNLVTALPKSALEVGRYMC
jgi:hypothetical protein